MPRNIYYDRRGVAATEVQYFHESRTKRPNKELDTNMPMDGKWPKAVKIKRILLVQEYQVISSTTARDSGKLDELATFLKSAIVQIQVGDGPISYLPAIAALASPKLTGAAAYTLATAADGTLAFGSISGPLDGSGIEVEIDVPADTLFNFYIKQLAATNIGDLQVLLMVEE